METKFQTSFIPRKPIPAPPGGLTPAAPHRQNSGGTSIFYMVGIFLFIISLLSIGGAYAAKYYFAKVQVDYSAELAEKKKGMPLNDIAHLSAQSTKIVLARQLMNNHLATSKIFSYLSLITVQNVRFLSMDATIPGGGSGTIQLTFKGQGKDFTSVAVQSDVLNNLNKYFLQDVIKNPIISDPGLSRNGTVTFGLNMQMNSSRMKYKDGIAPVEDTTPAPGEMDATVEPPLEDVNI